MYLCSIHTRFCSCVCGRASACVSLYVFRSKIDETYSKFIDQRKRCYLEGIHWKSFVIAKPTHLLLIVYYEHMVIYKQKNLPFLKTHCLPGN